MYLPARNMDDFKFTFHMFVGASETYVFKIAWFISVN
jgi:hypothetical protein